MFRRPKPPAPRRPLLRGHQTNVFSYRASRSPREGENGARRDVPRRFSRAAAMPVWISVGAIAIAVVYMSSLTTSPRVTVISDPGSVHRASEVYTEFASKELKSSFRNYSKLTIDSRGIESKLLAQFPELESVSVSVPLAAHRPLLKIVAGQPAFILQDANGSKYYINNSGLMLAKTSEIGGTSELMTVIDQSGLEVDPGSYILPEKLVRFIREINRQLVAADIEVAQIVLPTSPNELQIRVVGQPYFVRFNTAADPVLQAGSYLAIASELRRKMIVPQEYIDLRVEERAYFK